MKSDFTHIYLPGDASLPVLLLLHGTGGDERDLVELGQAVSPGSTILSVRGKVLENGMPRFFRRLAEGVFDLEDLAFRTRELTEFIGEARQEYGLKQPIYALGFSNGANIAASVMLTYPDALDGAILLRAMVPFEPQSLPDLSGKNVLILSGLMDPIVPADNARRLGWLFREAGAATEHRLRPASHGLVSSDVPDMQEFMRVYLDKKEKAS